MIIVGTYGLFSIGTNFWSIWASHEPGPRENPAVQEMSPRLVQELPLCTSFLPWTLPSSSTLLYQLPNWTLSWTQIFNSNSHPWRRAFLDWKNGFMMVYNHVWHKTLGMCEWGVRGWIRLTPSIMTMKVYRSAVQFFRWAGHSSCPVLICILQPRIWNQIF